MKLSLVIISPQAELHMIDYLNVEWYTFTGKLTVIINVILRY